MINSIKLNLETIESLLYFWNAVKDRENISEMFIYDLTAMQGLTLAYDVNFTEESVRRALSALKNREVFTRDTREEGRFYNNNLWMMEDLEYTNLMITPIKKLNLDFLREVLNSKFPNSKYSNLEVYFSPLHLNEYFIKDNKLVINFFRVKPSDFDDSTFIGDKELKTYIQEKLEEVLMTN
jgi:hypothetical protein